MPGGFLGVDVFFVISGYLITSLLLGEFRRGGHIELVRFWLRRARRLLPAVGVLIAVVMVVAAIFEPGRIATLRGDALASLAYVANWHFIFEPPVLLRAVRAALALPPPLVARGRGAVLPLLAARLRRRDDAASGAGACWSACSPARSARSLLAWILFDPATTPRGSTTAPTPTRRRCWSGVALAFVWSPIELRRRTAGPLVGRGARRGRRARPRPMVLLSFVHVHDYDLALYHGGYLWLASGHRAADRAPSPTRRRGSAACSASRRDAAGSGCAATASTSGTGRCWR